MVSRKSCCFYKFVILLRPQKGPVLFYLVCFTVFYFAKTQLLTTAIYEGSYWCRSKFRIFWDFCSLLLYKRAHIGASRNSGFLDVDEIYYNGINEIFIQVLTRGMFWRRLGMKSVFWRMESLTENYNRIGDPYQSSTTFALLLFKPKKATVGPVNWGVVYL